MKPLIVNLRGNNGSGKSTVARLLMAGNNARPLHTTEGKVWGYQFKVKGCKRQWVIIGRYTTACGGMDTLDKVSRKRIPELIQEAVDMKCNVFLEGIMLSTYYGAVGAYTVKFGSSCVFAYLDTPLEECIRRIVARRKAIGNTKLFDSSKQVIPRHKQIQSSRINVEQFHNRRTVTLPWQNPMPTLMRLIRKEG